MELTRASQLTKIEGVQIFVYGANGVGKTAESAAVCGDRTVVITDGNGRATIRSKWWREKYKCDPIVLEVKADETPTIPKLFDNLRNMTDELIDKHSSDWDAIVYDDLNTLRLSARNKAVDLNGTKGKSQTSNEAKSGKFKDIIIPAIQDFGLEMGLVESFLRETTTYLREAGKHCIINAHERLYTKEGTNTIYAIKPLLTGKDTPDTIPGIFDLVWYMRVIGSGQNTVREYITDTEAGIMAKTRWGGLFKQNERSSLKDVVARIVKWQKEGV